MRYLKANVEKPLSFASCGHFISEEKWIHNERIIDNFEVIIGVKGTVYIQQDDDKYEIKPGSVLLLMPGHVHKGYSFSEPGVSFYWLHFLCRDQYSIMEQREALVEISPLKSNPYLNKLKDSILVPVFSHFENIEKILIQFSQLLHIANTQCYTPLAADYLLTFMLMELTQLSIEDTFNNFGDSDINSRKFMTILEWIRINVQKDISVKEIAEHFNINADYLTRVFKKHLGVSTMKYINGMKISKAKELLYQTENSIKEISYELGFKDEKYFMKLFKGSENLTPTEYRNAYYKTYLNNR